MNQITKTVLLPKAGKARITFYRDRRRSTKDQTTFSLPFDVELIENTATGEVIYSPVFRSCRIMWFEKPDDEKTILDLETFIKEFLFGTLMSATEPIQPEEAEQIMNYLFDYFKSSVQYKITEDGACVLTIPVAGSFSKNIKLIIRKKDTGGYFLTDDGIILRSFRPHERGQKEKVIFVSKRLGIEIKEEELFLDTTADNLVENLYKFIQILSAVYLFYLTAN